MKKYLRSLIQIFYVVISIISFSPPCTYAGGCFIDGQCLADLTSQKDCKSKKSAIWKEEESCDSPPPPTCSSSALSQCTTQADCEGVSGSWENEQCVTKITPPPCSSSALNQCTTQADCEGVSGSWKNEQCSNTPKLILPKLEKVFGIDGNGKSVDISSATFAGGISIDDGTSFIDATQTPTPVELKKGGSIQIKGSITPANGHSSKSAELIVVGLYTQDVNDTSCIYTEGKHHYYMIVDTTEIYCEWKENGECKDGQKLPRVKSKDSANGYYSEWMQWDTNLANLKPFQSINLPSKLDDVQLYVDNNVGYTGFVCVNFGYRLEDKTLVFNGDPLKFKVSE